MTGMIDHRCSNYSHGIVSQNCLAKQYSDVGVEVKWIITGTFVQVHSIRDDDVWFCIVHDDMQPDLNPMVCKKADIINVPENLWGPLFTVKKVARLPLVKDSKIAETIGNISVGHTVQVLGPDNSVICIANVTFRNSIGRLGVGIYFGLQVLSPRENLSSIVERVSLLEPGAKGFPRGCDIVVTVDKILPSSCSVSKEKSVWNHERESQKQPVKNLCCGEDVFGGSLKTVSGCCMKEKGSNNYKKIQQRNSPDGEGNMNHCLRKVINSENPLNVGDEVIYLNGDTPEKGVVRWLGLIEKSLKVGVEFENPIGSGKGTVEGLGELFRTKYQHALFVPPLALIKLSDYLSSSKENIHSKKTNTNINNNNSVNNSIKTNNNNSINNNNDYITLSDFCCSGQHGAEEKVKKPKKTSLTHECIKHCDKTLDSNDSFQSVDKDEELTEVHHNWKSFDVAKPTDRKITYRRNCNSVDNTVTQKDSSSPVNGNTHTNFPHWNSPGHDLYDFTEPKQERIHGQCCSDPKAYKCPNGESPGRPTSHQEVVTMSSRILDEPYIPLPVIEQSILARKSNRDEGDGDVLYDVPPRNIRRVSTGGGREVEENERRGAGKDKWGWQCASPGNGEEQVSGWWESWKPSQQQLDRCIGEDLGKGSVVELSYKGEPHYGVIRWIGTLSEKREDSPPLLIAGVEMEEECADFTDGTFNNKRYFQCNPRKGLFVPLRKCRKDSRFLEESQKQSASSKVNYGQIDCPVVEGTIPPINTKDDIELICGKNRGIQGHHNSCYLDATLFSMFAFTSVFDSLLYRPPTSADIPQYNEVQRVLREEIVNPLRKNLYVRADRVMKLRTLLEKLSSISGLTSEEKDPEEFLNSLLAQILKAEPFLKLSSGQEAFHYQLFVEKDERLTLPSVQLLFEQSFVTSDIKLKQVPSCLIIQMPRFGKSFKMYSRILPPQLLDITDIIENSPRQCTVCGKLAEYECKDCFGQQGIGNGLESISFCKACLDTAHNHHCRSSHSSRALTVPVEFYELQDHCIIPRLFMELFAVVCIETSHYVAFVKCGSGSDAPWCFFDSMADRKGEQNGYNIPEMVPCPDLPYWLSEEGAKILNEMQDERQLPEHAKRLFSDAYMCMYQSPDLMMYR